MTSTKRFHQFQLKVHEKYTTRISQSHFGVQTWNRKVQCSEIYHYRSFKVIFSSLEDTFFHILLTGCKITYVPCFFLSGFKPSIFFDRLGSASRKCGKDTAAGISEAKCIIKLQVREYIKSGIFNWKIFDQRSGWGFGPIGEGDFNSRFDGKCRPFSTRNKVQIELFLASLAVVLSRIITCSERVIIIASCLSRSFFTGDHLDWRDHNFIGFLGGKKFTMFRRKSPRDVNEI